MIHHLFFENPGALFLFAFLTTFSLAGRSRMASSSFGTTAMLCSSIAFCGFVVVDAMNLLRGGMLWHDAANILSIGAAWLRGQPMYTPRGAADFYSLFYGPYALLIYVPFLALFHHPFFWMRLAISCADALSLFCLYTAIRVFLPRVDALALLSMATAVLLARPNELLGFRGDPWLLLCMCGAICLLTRSRGGALAMLLAGMLCGVAADLKITVIPAACLMLYLIYDRWGAKACRMAVAGCLAAGIGVFLLPRISIANYMSALELSAHQRFLRSTLLGNLIVAVMLLALAAVLFRNQVRVPAGRHRMKWLLAALAIGVCILTGSKESAGFWHLWPVMPFLLVGTAYEISRLRARTTNEELVVRDVSGSGFAGTSWIAVALLAASVGGCVTTLYFAEKDVRIFRPIATSFWKDKEVSAFVELQHIVNSPHAKNLSMGYGSDVTDYRTNLRYILPLARQEYFFDENEVVESIKEKLPVPANVLARVLGCEDEWLVPHGEVPFSALRAGVLPPGNSPFMFPAELRNGFVPTHLLLEQGQFYDRWGCSAAAK
jgi:hypothetical protein